MAANAPMLGLANETGSILNVYKRYLRDKIDLAANKEFLKRELGDLLWYASAVATAFKLDLGQIAEDNLRRTADWYPARLRRFTANSFPVLDATYLKPERFPRRLVVKFVQERRYRQLFASVTLLDAQPNAFPSGPWMRGRRKVGFQVNGPLGDPLTDNSRRADAYRFHDAIHMGFMAVLGWSPTMRSLLSLKRKSKRKTDESEDGARAIYAEEGLATLLARLAETRQYFATEQAVDSDTLAVVKAATAGLEVETLPTWLWRRAISKGFTAMKQLEEHQGGYLHIDLDARDLKYSKLPPPRRRLGR